MKTAKINIGRSIAGCAAAATGFAGGIAVSAKETFRVDKITSHEAHADATFAPGGVAEISESPTGFSFPNEKTSWTKSDERRFVHLAALRASGEASEDENAEFAQLQRLRRTLANPMSPEEVMAEWNRRRFLSDLMNVLSKHAEFLRPEDQQRFRATMPARG